MACTGHSNTPNGVACTGHIPPVGPYAYSPSDLVGGTHVIDDTHYNQVRTSLAQELTRRGLSWASVGGDPGTVGAGGQVTAQKWRDLRDRIYSVKTFTQSHSANTNLVTGGIVHEEMVEELRAAVTAAKAECVCNCNYSCTCNCNYCTCNCNYCTCNCNYCTCNCNYCTCNCNYCTCNCNYACTCNCNYSDDRLKKEIEYL